TRARARQRRCRSRPAPPSATKRQMADAPDGDAFDANVTAACLGAAFDLSQTALVALDAAGKVVFANEPAGRFIARAPAELRAAPFGEAWLAPSARARVGPRLGDVLRH